MSAIPVSQPARAPLAVSLLLSVFVHAGVVGSVATVFAVRELIAEIAPWVFAKDKPEEKDKDAAKAANPTAPQFAESDPVIWVKPGIDDSTSDAHVWIGYNDESEHSAYASSVDQSAMTIDQPGMRGEEQSIAPPSPEVTPGDPLPPSPQSTALAQKPPPDAPPAEVATPANEDAAPANTPVPQVPDPASADKDPAPAPATPAKPVDVDEKAEPQPKPVPAAPPSVTLAHEATPTEAPEQPQPKVEQDRKEHVPPTHETTILPATPPSPPVPDRPKPDKESPEAAPTPPQVTAEPAKPAESKAATPPPATTATPGAKPTPIPAGDPGEKADKEADATSIKKAVIYHNGHVRAGEGIDIKTVRPEFSNFTMLTTMPRAPVVEITFTIKGKVKSVRMLQSSGYKDVDEPILNAVWAWSAKGKKLDALARQNPKAVLKISVRMLL